MKRTIFILFVLVSGFGCSWAYAATQKHVLDNGMTVLVNEMPSSPMAAINLSVKTGSANEGRFMASGITHFVEHMLFKGTPKRPAGVIPEEARAMGGYINASTGYDHTDYVLSVPRAELPKALDLLSDMLMNPSFDPAELEKERQVILKEMNMLNDKPDRKLGELLYQTVYHVHPYQFPIIGREDVFRALRREDLLEYHRSLYVPNNMIISVAGGVGPDDVLSLVREKFKDVKARSFPLRNVPQEPEQIFLRRVEMPYPTDLTRMIMAYQGVALLDKDLYALDVLSMAMGQGASSRLYLELYKKERLVEGISAGNPTPQDRGFFQVSSVMKAQDPDKVIKAVKAMIADVQAKGLLPGELAKIKRQVMADNIYERQTAEGMADKAAMEESFTGDPDFSERYLEGIKAVTNDDIKRVAATYLVDQRLSIVILKPKKDAALAGDAVPVMKSDIEKTVLSNGLTLLLKEDRTLPMVSMSVVFNGGMRQETVELNGLSSLLGSVWIKGAAGVSADDIQRQFDARGASISSYAGRNSFVLGMTVLAEDQLFMFEHLERFMTAPAFPDVEIDRDKEQMRTALVARKDSVLDMSSRALVETLFQTHPYRLDSLGTEESLGRITRAKIMDVFSRYIRPDNGVIAVFGDIDKKQVRRELERRLGKMKPGKPELKIFSEDAPAATRVKELTLDKEQAAVMFAFRGPLIGDSDRYALDAAVNILSSSLGGRLFKRVREELGKSYTVSGRVSPGVDAGMVYFFALTTEEGAAKVRSIMEEEFARIRTELVADKELNDAKAYLISKMARDMQTLGAQAVTRSVDELLGLGYSNADDEPQRLGAVTREDVRAAARKYLDTAHAAIVVSRPGISVVDRQ
jgi:zinc protease